MNEKKIFNYLMDVLKNEKGVAAVMGNLYAESTLNSSIVQTSYRKKNNVTNDEYVKKTNSGDHDFVNDKAGFGLAQWTYWSRKKALLEKAKKENKSIDDLELQLDFLIEELKGYKSLFNNLKKSDDLYGLTQQFMCSYERPSDQSESAILKRYNYALKYFSNYEVNASYELIASEVIAGKWGNGNERKEKLTDAGYDYKKVQALVNERMKK